MPRRWSTAEEMPSLREIRFSRLNAFARARDRRNGIVNLVGVYLFAPETSGPRTRGEDYNGLFDRSHASGSPPHARGGRPGAEVGGVGVRFTPARAGRTGSLRLPSAALAVHPRTRGEDTGTGTGDEALGGSPPHARGRRVLGFGEARSLAVHPRTRGEDMSRK